MMRCLTVSLVGNNDPSLLKLINMAGFDDKQTKDFIESSRCKPTFYRSHFHFSWVSLFTWLSCLLKIPGHSHRHRRICSAHRPLRQSWRIRRRRPHSAAQWSPAADPRSPFAWLFRKPVSWPTMSRNWVATSPSSRTASVSGFWASEVVCVDETCAYSSLGFFFAFFPLRTNSPQLTAPEAPARVSCLASLSRVCSICATVTSD